MIPVVDDIDNLELLYDCITKYGFCYVPIGLERISLVENILQIEKEFFDLDDDTKNMYKMNKDGIGYIPKNRYSKTNNITEIKEQITIRPGEIVLGHGHDQTINKYYESIYALAKKIFQNLLKCIGVDYNEYNDFFNTLTLLHYKKDNNLSDNDLGIREHTDWGYMTVLWTDNDGLQIEVNDEWTNVPTLKDHFIINIGDMLEVLSDGKYKSTLHRVIISQNRQIEKYSAALFFEPSLSTIIKGSNKEISFEDYINEKINESYAETNN